MTNIKQQTALYFTKDEFMFIRPRNADLCKNLMAAFVKVNPIVGAGLKAGQHYLGGIVFELCETSWFFSGLGELTESVGNDVGAAFCNWFNDGVKAETIFDEVKHIIITTAVKLGWEIDLSMVYSVTLEYLKSWVAEISMREVEDVEEQPDMAGVAEIEKPSGHLSVSMPKFSLRVEKKLVMLVSDEDNETIVIWYWRIDLKETQPRSELWRNNNGFDPQLINLQIAHAPVVITRMFIDQIAGEVQQIKVAKP